jgi:hypothetical protein
VKSENKMVVKASAPGLKMIPQKNIREYISAYIPEAQEVKKEDFISQVRDFVKKEYENIKKINEIFEWEEISEVSTSYSTPSTTSSKDLFKHKRN